MKYLDLIDFIYGPSKLPRCRDCQRPLKLVEEYGHMALYCKHCEDLAREDAEKEKYENRRKE